MNDIAIGGNTKLSQLDFTLEHNIPSSTDVSVFSLKDTTKVEGDEGMIFYGAPTSDCGSVKLASDGIVFKLDNMQTYFR